MAAIEANKSAKKILVAKKKGIGSIKNNKILSETGMLKELYFFFLSKLIFNKGLLSLYFSLLNCYIIDRIL